MSELFLMCNINRAFVVMDAFPVEGTPEATVVIDQMMPFFGYSDDECIAIMNDWFSAQDRETCLCENPECKNVILPLPNSGVEFVYVP